MLLNIINNLPIWLKDNKKSRSLKIFALCLIIYFISYMLFCYKFFYPFVFLVIVDLCIFGLCLSFCGDKKRRKKKKKNNPINNNNLVNQNNLYKPNNNQINNNNQVNQNNLYKPNNNQINNNNQVKQNNLYKPNNQINQINQNDNQISQSNNNQINQNNKINPINIVVEKIEDPIDTTSLYIPIYEGNNSIPLY
jgi:hypothetical protein